jgi:hypothetical protein
MLSFSLFVKAGVCVLLMVNRPAGTFGRLQKISLKNKLVFLGVVNEIHLFTVF